VTRSDLELRASTLTLVGGADGTEIQVQHVITLGTEGNTGLTPDIIIVSYCSITLDIHYKKLTEKKKLFLIYFIRE